MEAVQETTTAIVPAPDPPTPAAPLKPPTSHGRTGKVARLPKSLRDQINIMIQDGVPYLEIIAKLGLASLGIAEGNLSTWKTGGYLDWTRQNQIATAIQGKYEFALKLIAESNDENAAGQALLHAVALQFCEFLADTDPATIRDSLLSDADKMTRLVNSMVRLAEGGIKCETHKLSTRAQARAAAQTQKNQKRGISEQSLQEAEQALKLL